MSAGTISAMISSLKSNNSLRRKKKSYSLFYKKPTFGSSILNPLSKEDNQAIVEENKRLFVKKSRRKRIFALIIVSFYVAIALIALSIL